MSIHYQIDVSTSKLQLTVGTKIIKVLWYITNTEKDHISILLKHFNEDKHELYVFFRRYTPEIDIILQQIKLPNNIIHIPDERLIASLPIVF